MKPQLALIGGLLGAGKTTLLRSLALHLNAQGRKVALITNDQTGGLVDTIFLQNAGLAVEEVVGACFCCDFNGLTQAILNSLSSDPDIILAEPVGSCTDLQSTVLAPLRDLLGDTVSVLPLTVLVDPHRITEMNNVTAGDVNGEAVRYIYSKQLEEADLIALTKIDTIDGEVRLDHLQWLAQFAPAVALSAVTEEGREHWWNTLQAVEVGDTRLREIDYKTYADAEAAMGWINMKLSVRLSDDASEALAGFLRRVVNAIEQRNGRIGNFKVALSRGLGFVKGGLLRSNDEPVIEGTLRDEGPNEPGLDRTVHDKTGLGTTSAHAMSFTENSENTRPAVQAPKTEMTINLRATVDADDLKGIILGLLSEWSPVVVSVDALHPAPPNPTHRYAP